MKAFFTQSHPVSLYHSGFCFVPLWSSVISWKKWLACLARPAVYKCLLLLLFNYNCQTPTFSQSCGLLTAIILCVICVMVDLLIKVSRHFSYVPTLSSCCPAGSLPILKGNKKHSIRKASLKKLWLFIACLYLIVEVIALPFGKRASLLSCPELDERIDSTLMSVF